MGRHTAHYVFGLGILGMTMSSIPLHMLVCGFIAVEIFKVKPGGWGYRLATLIPIPGVLGPIVWSKIGFWMAVPTSVFCFFLLPIAYISFIILQNRRDYLCADRPQGARRLVWNLLMGLAVLVVTGGAIVDAIKRIGELTAKLG